MKVKRMLRGAVEGATRGLGLLAHFEREASGSLTILTYHRVVPDAQCGRAVFESLVMPESAFAAEMRYLARHYEVLPVREALARLRAGPVHAARPLLAVTFDDGYADNARIAAPILKALGLRATFFVVSSFVKHGTPLWFDAAARSYAAQGFDHQRVAVEIEGLKNCSPALRDQRIAALPVSGVTAPGTDDSAPMTTTELIALARAGHEIGAHTVSHPVLPPTDDAELEKELVHCRAELEALVEMKVEGLCYPNGNHDPRVREAAFQAGYSYSCTTESGRNHSNRDAFLLNRIDVTPGRVLDHRGRYCETAFRSEISLLRDRLWRGKSALEGSK